MKKLAQRRIVIHLLLIAVLVAASLYTYRISFAEEPAISSPSPTVQKVSRFNSLVPGVFILNEHGQDYGAIGAIFASVGYDVMEGNLAKYQTLTQARGILIVPEKEARGLTAEETDSIAAKVAAGGKIITWGQSPLSEQLGIIPSNGRRVINSYTWRDHVDTPITLKSPAVLGLFGCPDDFAVLAEEKDKNPVMVAGDYGAGQLIYAGIPLVGSSGAGYEHFPFILEAVDKQFGITPAFSRDNLALYVDIGYHDQESATEVARKVQSYGANQINLSAWFAPEHYGDRYREIIDACHERGIAVFAWFELPLVSMEFWDQHPEWREKTASGDDAFIDWRHLMALNNPAALAEVKQTMTSLIRDFDWDGVDIAEIYFEAPGEGFTDKSKFTPMNDSFRSSFEAKFGVDPSKAFDPLSIYYWLYNRQFKQNIVDYRVELITNLHEQFLTLCATLKQEKPHLQTSVTVIDSLMDEDMRTNIGVDAGAIAKLQDKYHFMLQIEDPFTLWNLGPDRYRVIGDAYRQIMPAGQRLSIDINVIDRGGEVYPTKKQRGVELYQLLNSASKYTDKVILYALATVEPADMKLAPFAMSSDVKVHEIATNEVVLTADKWFIWNTSTAGKTFFIDGVKWPFVSKRGVIIPGGGHTLRVQESQNDAELFIESINAEISAVAQDQSIRFFYSSEGRAYVTVNKKPTGIRVDGQIVNPVIIENDENCVIILPQGQHRVEFQ